jgi:hypothetical protein
MRAVNATSDKPPGSSARFGVISDIHGHSVTLSGDAISGAKKKGVEFTIRNPVTLGMLTDVDVLGFKPGEILKDVPGPSIPWAPRSPTRPGRWNTRT